MSLRDGAADQPRQDASRPASRNIALTALMGSALAVALFPYLAFAILSGFLLDDLDITRAQLGWVAAGFSLTGALGGPLTGRLTDRFGARRMLQALFAVSFLGLIFIASAPNYVLLLAASTFAGLAQSASNPITNKLIVTRVPFDRRAITTGLKQSGVQVGIFLSGLLLPLGALALGWRTALVVAASIPLVTMTLVPLVLPRTSRDTPVSRTDHSGSPLPAAIWWLGWYGFLMGLGSSTYLYLPLYSQEEVGVSLSVAGAIVGVAAGFAIFSRIAVSQLSMRAKHFSGPLWLISVASVLSAGAVWSASHLGVGLLWVGGILAGAITPAAIPVVWLAVMSSVRARDAGRASGIPTLGYGAGFAVGTPLFGYSVDVTGGYDLGYAAVAVTYAASALLIWRWRVGSRPIRP